MFGSRMVATSSGLLSASSQICSLPSYLMGIDVNAPASGISNITIYDSANSSVSGKLVIAEIQMDAGFMSLNHEYMAPVVANSGIYAVLTGQPLTFIIRFALGG